MANTKRVLVTGAAGFIGSYLVEEFARAARERGTLELIATDRAGAYLQRASELGATVVEADLTSEHDAQRLAAKADIIIHAAGVYHADVSWEIIREANVGTVHRLTDAAVKAGVQRLVLISSTGVYGLPRLIPAREGDAKAPRNAFERSKWEGEQAAMARHGANGFEVNVLRPAMAYGPRGRTGVAGLVALVNTLRQLHSVKHLPICLGGHKAHFVHARDIARAGLVVALHERAAGRAFNVADRTPVTVEQILRAVLTPQDVTPVAVLPSPGAMFNGLIQLVGKLTGKGRDNINGWLREDFSRLAGMHGLVAGIVPVLDEELLAVLAGNHVYDTAALRSLGFQWAYPDFTAGLAETFAWYRENRWVV